MAEPTEVSKELAEMLQSLEGPQTEQPAQIEQEPPAVTEPVVEPPVEPPVEPAVEPAVESPVVVEPLVEPPVEPDLAVENDKLRQMLNEMAKKVREPGAPPPKSAEPLQPALAPEVLPAKVIEQWADFITDEDADLLIDKPKEVLLRFGQRIAKTVEEQLLRALPGLIGPVASHQVQAMQKAVKFYETNKDLKQYEDFCILTATQIEVEHPDWGTDAIYEETAKVARARLGLRQEMEQQNAQPDSTPSMKPALPGGATSRKPSGGPVLSEQQKDMVDLLNLG